jgi:5-methyltetrahydropteroyltriglutamate--homocysteine methyltransferase
LRAGFHSRTRSFVGLNAYVPGIYPRSEALVQATRDLDRGRTSQAVVDGQLDSDVRDFVRVQEQAGLTLRSDGLLTWQDLFRPLADRSDGLDARPLTRFLDTNTFYRAILVEGEPQLREPIPPSKRLAERWGATLPERWLATLPSPVAFSRATKNEASASLLAANVLAPQIDAYAAAGCSLIVLSDPFLAREGGIPELRAALSELPASVPMALHLPFADARPVLSELADLPVDAIGVDFYATSLDAVPEDYPKEIMAGVIDARSSALENPYEIARFVQAIMERRPAAVSLVPNGDLQFVPEPIARQKVGCLGNARAGLEEAA